MPNTTRNSVLGMVRVAGDYAFTFEVAKENPCLLGGVGQRRKCLTTTHGRHLITGRVFGRELTMTGHHIKLWSEVLVERQASAESLPVCMETLVAWRERYLPVLRTPNSTGDVASDDYFGGAMMNCNEADTPTLAFLRCIDKQRVHERPIRRRIKALEAPSVIHGT
ncbi:hypothetical protein LZ30DRAFT_358838 [Colletotrichum cereale]|nr:hypothetical protein LZ30DRAFT_358838 [Colletotrichum cereale]